MVAKKDDHSRPRIPALTSKFLFFVILSAFMLINDQRNDYLSLLRNSIAIAIYPLQSLVEAPSRISNWIEKRVVSREMLIEENKNLQDQEKINLITRFYASILFF